ncbi:hypothetical protein H0H92_001571, partial [Tricholoma furcatifolium]
AKPPVSNSLPRPLGRPPRLPLVVLRSPIVSGPELSLFVKLGVTRSPLSSSSGSSPSRGSFVKSPRISRPISASSRPRSWPSRRLPRPTSSLFSKILTWLLSTPSESP